jgi:hypothetical protein
MASAVLGKRSKVRWEELAADYDRIRDEIAAVVPYDIPRGCVATYCPEGNVLVPITSVADLSNQPTYKSVRVTLHPSADPSKVGAQIRAQAVT